MTWSIVRKPVLEALADDLGTFDAVLCDPPYGLGFMGKGWDHGVPSADVWRAARAHLRPGALMLAFGGSRTWHRLAVGIEDAGLEIRDTIFAWLYGMGWAKPADVGQYIDKRLGVNWAERTAPVTPEAEHWNGYHANLKPSCEPVVVARVPLEGGLAGNALAHGVAGFNVDGCRIPSAGRVLIGGRKARPKVGKASSIDVGSGFALGTTDLGRWPANVVLTCEEAICGPGDPREIEHKPGCHVYELDQQSGVLKSGVIKAGQLRKASRGGGGYSGNMPYTMTLCDTYGDEGGASRFFYTGKVRASERGASAHPCMKPLALCEYLARLILPPVRRDGAPRRILVPFSGSGSEMVGALRAGWDEVVGVEYDAGCDNPGKRPDYWADVAELRLAEWEGKVKADVPEDVVCGPLQLGLFGKS